MRAMRDRFTKAADLTAPLAILESRGWIRPRPQAAPGRPAGGPPPPPGRAPRRREPAMTAAATSRSAAMADPTAAGQRDSGTQPDTTGSVGFCPAVPVSQTRHAPQNQPLTVTIRPAHSHQAIPGQALKETHVATPIRPPRDTLTIAESAPT